MSQRLDGKYVAELLKQELAARLTSHTAQHRPTPGLAVVLIGGDPASEIYVGKKQQACTAVGMHSFLHQRDASVTQKEILALIDDLNHDKKVHGILVQLPLPSHLNTYAILDAIHPDKDVDGFHPYNLGLLAQRRPRLRPCTPYGIIHLLTHYKISLKGLNATVVGASNIVGRPMALELTLAGATVTLCHSATRNLKFHVENADLVVAATGKPGLIESEWIKQGAIVIDVGIHRLANGKIGGDIDFESAEKRASWITPVPGGVGPMTVATLLLNTLHASELQNAS